MCLCLPSTGLATQSRCKAGFVALGNVASATTLYALRSAHLPIVYASRYGDAKKSNASHWRAHQIALAKSFKDLPGYLLTVALHKAYSASFSDDQFVAATPSFEEWGPDECLVVANFHADSDFHKSSIKQLFQRRYETSARCTRYIEVKSLEEMLSKLEKVKAETGKPIGRLQINSHGSPGLIDAPDDFDIEMTFLENFVRSGRPVPTDLFAPAAEIRIVSCSTGQGAEGEAFTQRLGNVFLKRGGVVWSAKLTLSNRRLFGPFWPFARESTHLLAPVESAAADQIFHFGVYGRFRATEFHRIWDPIRKTEIPADSE